MRTSDGHLSAVGKVFVGIVVMGFLLVATLVTIVVLALQARDQSRDNEQHIDCIVASAMDPPPEACASIIEQLREDGILRTPTTVAP